MKVSIFALFCAASILGVVANAAPSTLTQIESGQWGCGGDNAITTFADGKIYSWCPYSIGIQASVRVDDPISGKELLTWRPQSGEYLCKDFFLSAKNGRFVAFSCITGDYTKTATALKSLDSSDTTDGIFEVGSIRSFLSRGNQFLSTTKNQLFFNEASNGHLTSKLVASFTANVDDVVAINKGNSFVVRIGTKLFLFDTNSLKQKWTYSLPLSSPPDELGWLGVSGGAQKLVIAYRTNLFGEYHFLSINPQTGTIRKDRVWRFDAAKTSNMLVEPYSITLSDDESVVEVKSNGLPHGLYVFDASTFNNLFQTFSDVDVLSNYTFDPSSKTVVGYYIYQAAKKKAVRTYDVMTGSSKDLPFVNDTLSYLPSELTKKAYLIALNYLVSVGDGEWTTYVSK